jgi:hypothetical protein
MVEKAFLIFCLTVNQIISKKYCRTNISDRFVFFFQGIGWPHGQDLGPDTIANDLVPAETLKVA